MRTIELKRILKPFFNEFGQVYPVKMIDEKRIEEEAATIVEFVCDDYKLFAVIYDDGTCFTPYDWDVDYETMEEVDEWIDQRFVKGIVLNGLPRRLV